jgi:uncharacterized protein with PIN domain
VIRVTLKLNGGLSGLVRGGGSRSAPDTVVRRLPEPTSAKDAVEAVGIPHCEIGQITRDGEPLDLAARIGDGALLVVSPAAPRALRDPRFICDRHLGKLARLLRIMGFDVAYGADWSEPGIARRAVTGRRVLLSRGRAILMRSAVAAGLLIRSDDPDTQAAEVLQRFRLTARVRLFGRCSLCNGVLAPVAKREVGPRIPPLTARWRDLYFLCRSCDQLYWEGTHVAALRDRIAAIVARAE